MKPKVITHTQISLDGCIRGFENPAAYYTAAAKIDADMVLFGSNTVIEAFLQAPEDEDKFRMPAVDANDLRPWGVIADSRGKVKHFGQIIGMGYLKGIIVLVSATTPEEYLQRLGRAGVDTIQAGDDHVDYAAAFEELNRRYGCRTIRTDSGGTLTCALLNQQLADEISLVVSPCLTGGADTVFRQLRQERIISLELIGSEVLEGGYLWMRHRVLKPAEH